MPSLDDFLNNPETIEAVDHLRNGSPRLSDSAIQQIRYVLTGLGYCERGCTCDDTCTAITDIHDILDAEEQKPSTPSSGLSHEEWLHQERNPLTKDSNAQALHEAARAIERIAEHGKHGFHTGPCSCLYPDMLRKMAGIEVPDWSHHREGCNRD